MQALDELVKQGKVKAVGLSNFKLSEIERCARTRRVDVVQYCWNMFDRRMQKEIFPYCRENGIGVMAYGSLAYGMLTGHAQRGVGVRERRLALTPRQAREHQSVSASVRSRTLSEQPARGRGFEANREAVQQNAAAACAALDALESRHQHGAGGMPQSARSRRQRRRARLVDIGRRYERDRRSVCSSRCDHDARNVARD